MVQVFVWGGEVGMLGSMISAPPGRPLNYMIWNQFGKSTSITKYNMIGIPTSNVSATLSSSTVAPPIPTFYGRRFQPSPELGLLSLFFVLSTAIGAIFSLALLSIPTIHGFRRLSGSIQNLSKLVSEELPGTLSSLKLSALEINQLTQQLTHLRQKLSATQHAYGSKITKPNSSFRTSNYPIVD